MPYYRLLLTHALADHNQARLVPEQHMIRLIERFLYNAAYLFIYFTGGLLTVVALFAKVPSQEHQFFFVPQSHRANPAAHTIFSNHRACDLSHALNIV